MGTGRVGTEEFVAEENLKLIPAPRLLLKVPVDPTQTVEYEVHGSTEKPEFGCPILS